MIGAITGDIIGSIYEWNNIKSKDFPLFGEGCDFTDDSVHTIAIADWLIGGGNLSDILGNYTLKYSGRGYGGMLLDWATQQDREPYNSWGNGSAMRVTEYCSSSTRVTTLPNTFGRSGIRGMKFP
jgi:ADP-ribosylglycohydrolase